MADDRKIMVVSSIPPRFGHKNADGSPKAEWADLASLTWATQRAYCDRHGYDFHGDVSDIWDNVASPWQHTPPPIAYAPIRHFQKIRLMLHFMTPERCRQNFDWVCWLDADLVIGDYDTPLTKWTNTRGADSGEEQVYGGDFILPWDVNTYHPTVMMARCTTQMRALMWAMTEAGQRLYHLHDWSEHMALKFFSYPPYRDAIHQHSAKVLCAMPPGVHPMPDDVRALYEYEEGVSFALHLSAMSIEKRIELARAFIAEHPIP